MGMGVAQHYRSGPYVIVDRRLPRLNSGSLHTRALADDSRVFRLRFNADGGRQIVSLHERHGCECGCGGGWDEPAARRELAETVARIRLGVWKRPTTGMRARRAGSGTSFQAYARQWLAAKTEGTLVVFSSSFVMSSILDVDTA
jgi:hypothetical protein